MLLDLFYICTPNFIFLCHLEVLKTKMYYILIVRYLKLPSKNKKKRHDCLCASCSSSQCYIMCDLQSGNTGCGCKSHTWDFINSSYHSFSNTCLATSSSCGVHHFNNKSIGSKRHSIHTVELSQWYGKPCAYLSVPPVPSIRGPMTIFWQAGHADPLDGWQCSS